VTSVPYEDGICSAPFLELLPVDVFLSTWESGLLPLDCLSMSSAGLRYVLNSTSVSFDLRLEARVVTAMLKGTCIPHSCHSDIWLSHPAWSPHI
jgi:hypothetical protein